MVDVYQCGVVIPAYNAEHTISNVLENLIDFGFNRDNIVVVNDGSVDATSSVARRYGVQVVDHNTNKGKGAALKAGINIMHMMDVPGVFTIDADGQHRVEEIGNFIPMTETYDIIIGRRREEDPMPVLRRFVNKITSLITSVIVHTRIHDVQCGFRFVSFDVLKRVSLKTDHYETETEIVVKAIRSRYRVTSVPIATVYDNQHSHIQPFADTCRFACMMIGFLWA
jgi:glycosyltransferase involved in cell wall biosynthesis